MLSRRRLAALLDPAAALLLLLAAPALWLAARLGRSAPLSRRVLDRVGVSAVRHHYYEPIVRERDLWRPLDAERDLPGIDINATGQLALLAQFRYRDELLTIPRESADPLSFAYHNDAYASGDAEMLYNVIRHFRPRQLVEVGSGRSTLLARLAIDRNRAADPAYACRHLCIEPYEQPWLESVGVEVLRQRVELVDRTLFATLAPGDILFIDSSHVLRPQGDVAVLFLEILPRLRPGVLIHVHDIFTPRDYPAEWVIADRRLWTEQYLVEALLSGSRDFEVLLAVNWLARHHRGALGEACPVLLEEPARLPGALWLRRRGASEDGRAGT